MSDWKRNGFKRQFGRRRQTVFANFLDEDTEGGAGESSSRMTPNFLFSEKS